MSVIVKISEKSISFLQLSNIDSALSALGISLYAQYMLGTSLPLQWTLVIVFSVWSVYTSDHLLDGFKWKTMSLSNRYRTHYVFRYLYILSVCLSCIIVFGLSLSLDVRIQLIGYLLVCLCVPYLFLCQNKEFSWLKNISIGIIYTVGIWAGPLLLTSYRFYPLGLLVCTCFFIAVLINLTGYDYIEYSINNSEDSVSLSLVLHRQTIRLFLWTMGGIGLGFCGLLYWTYPDHLIGIILLFMMIVIPIMLCQFKYFDTHLDTYRFFSELVFLVPILVFLG